MIRKLTFWFFARFTSYSPTLLEWLKHQEQAADTSARKIRRANVIEGAYLGKRKEDRS